MANIIDIGINLYYNFYSTNEIEVYLMSLIKCNNLYMGYEGKIVINDLNFTVKHGEYLCIVGENGSGKSTLIKGLLRTKSPMDGSIEYCDCLKNNEIGFLPQQKENTDDFPASVNEVVLSGRINSMGIRPFYNKEDKAIAYDNMALLGISGIKNMRFTDLSGGQKQRVLLARALCATKRLLLLDEPAAGLDPKITKELYELIDTINKERKITIIMVSHDVDAALKYADTILHLGETKYFYGTKDEYICSDIGQRFLAKGSSLI